MPKEENRADDARRSAGLSCTEVADRIPEYLINQLAEDVTERMGKHLQACFRCRAKRAMLELALEMEAQDRGLRVMGSTLDT